MLQQFHNIGRNRPQAASWAYRHYCRAPQRDGRARIGFRNDSHDHVQARRRGV